jgi:PAS domain S-box-containing protein
MQPHVVPSVLALPSGAAGRVATPPRPVALPSGGRRDAAAVGLDVAAAGRRRSPGRRLRERWSGRDRSLFAVLDASADAVLGIGPDGRAIFVNLAACTLFESPADALAGRPAHELVPEMAAAVDEARRRILGGHRTGPTGDGLDLVVRTQTGRQIPVTAWFSPVLGRRRFLVAVTLRDLRPQHDIDDLCLRLDEQARQARATVGAVLGAVTDRLVVLADPDGLVVRVNRAVEKLLGYRSGELVGRPISLLSDPGDLAEVARELGVPDGVDPLLELARWGLPNRQDWDLVTREGRRRPVSLAVSPIGDRSAPQGFVCVASDRCVEWQPQVPAGRRDGERLLLDLDDAATRVLSWGVGRSGSRAGG